MRDSNSREWKGSEVAKKGGRDTVYIKAVK